MQTGAPVRNENPRTGGFAHPERNVAALGIESGSSVADFGSGSGAYVFAVAESLKGSGHVYAVDVQKDLLRRISNEATKRGFKNVEVIWADLEIPRASKLGNGVLDLVLVSNILFQVSDKQALLSEARRVLKTMGRLVIIDWSGSFGRGEAGREGVGEREFPAEEGSERSERWKTVGFQRGLGPITEEVVKKEAAIELAEKSGFKLVKEFPAGAHHYGLILRPVAMAQ